MRSSILVTLLAVVPLFALSPADGAEVAGFPPGFGGTTDVEVVNVEAFVTEKGRPVADLTAGDFRVYQDGKPVEVLYFSRIDGGLPQHAEAEPLRSAGDDWSISDVAGQPVARFVIYVDSLFLGPARRAQLFDQLRGAVVEALKPGDEVMVVQYDGNLNILLPFTTDRTALRKALTEAEKIDVSQMVPAMSDRRAMENIRDYQEYEGGGEGDCISIGALAQQYSSQVEHRVALSVGALTAFVNSLSGMPGRKAILHVTDGMPLIAGGEGWQYALELCDGTGAAEGVPNARDVRQFDWRALDRWDPRYHRTDMFEFDTTKHWRRLGAHANAHNVTLYPVQASGLDNFGLVGNVHTSQRTATFDHRNRQDSLFFIAEETGGKAILDTNDFGTRIRDMIDDSRAYYLLGFEPSKSPPGSRHKIRVEVDRPGVEVRHRQSYQRKAPDERIANSVLTSLLHERSENPLGVDLSVERSRIGETRSTNRATVRFRVALESLTTLPQGDSRHGMVTVFLMARDRENGSMTPVHQASVPLRLPLETIEEPFVYEIEMPMEAGKHDIAAAVRDDFAGVTSFLRQSVDFAVR